MLKHFDGPKEPAYKRAQRRWKNHRIATEFKAKKAEAKAAPPELKESLIIENEKPKNDILTKTHERFKKEIRKMLEDHKQKNIESYRAVIVRERRRLMLEKIRRLEASIAASEARIAQREGRFRWLM
jgi:hypothetical protein